MAHFRYMLVPPGPTQEMELMGPGEEGPPPGPPPPGFSSHGKQQGMVLKSVFSSDFFTPFLAVIGRGAQPMIGGGGGARSDVTVVLVMKQVVNASWRSNKKGEVKEK